MRAYGVGRIFLRGRTYWAAYCVRGKEIRESTGHTDERKAASFLKHRLREVGADQLGLQKFIEPKTRQLTINDLLAALKKDFEIRGKLSARRKSELARADADFGDHLAITLSPEAIDAYIKGRLGAAARPATINRITQLVGQAYHLAIERGELHAAPHIRHLSEADNARKGFFERAPFDTVVAHLKPALADYALFAYLTGWRRGEIASLEWSDIEDDVIRLRPENSKNGEPRQVVIDGDEFPALIARRRQDRLVNGVLCNLVFHRAGAPIGDFRKAWYSACVAGGVGKMVCRECRHEGTARECCGKPTKYVGRIFHDFRRTAVRDMIRGGVPQTVAMKISGHKTDSIFRRYDIADEKDLRQAMKSLEQYRKNAAAKVVAMEPQAAVRKIRTTFGQSANKGAAKKAVSAANSL